MKYDLSKKLTIGAKRTLTTLQHTMLEMLAIKSFEEITVQEICENSMLPRATFYNYFDDKYDLLEYCLLSIHQQIASNQNDYENCQLYLNALLENFIIYFDANITMLDNILKNNLPNQYLINQVRYYLIKAMSASFNSKDRLFKIPKDMAARIYSDAVLIILEWKYLYKKDISPAQAKSYLQTIVSGIN